jgi:crotonobetainyl-CoA:carnitine CoA-transferase CaiB-like acyl-CoA transferase
MLESLVEWISYPLYYAFDGAPPPPRTGASHATIYPYGPFPGRRRSSVMLGCRTNASGSRSATGPAQARSRHRRALSGNSKRVAARAELEQVIVDVFAR